MTRARNDLAKPDTVQEIRRRRICGRDQPGRRPARDQSRRESCEPILDEPGELKLMSWGKWLGN
jgi:hypothetical protein